ncbi:hypothetical protein QL285_092869 [Trifolium repens]|nr:hypothetical protein QL285_092869 [Trifolium repens]
MQRGSFYPAPNHARSPSASGSRGLLSFSISLYKHDEEAGTNESGKRPLLLTNLRIKVLFSQRNIQRASTKARLFLYLQMK